jgi:hypothetical protein
MNTLSLSSLDAYQIADPDAVRAFLQEHPFMEPLLGEVAAQLAKYFPNAPLRLQVETEMEATGRLRPQLVIETIVAGWTPDDAQDAMDEFAHQWWLDQMHRGQSRLIPTLAFG